MARYEAISELCQSWTGFLSEPGFVGIKDRPDFSATLSPSVMARDEAAYLSEPLIRVI